VSNSRIITGDCREVLASLPDRSVQCCITSPPYFGLRDYGIDGQIGLEQTPEAFVAEMVSVFREVRRVLRDDGTLWLNLGDSYAGAGYSNHQNTGGTQRDDGGKQKHTRAWREGSARADGDVREDGNIRRNRNGVGPVNGCKPKDLIGIPWRVAFALQADGWYLRQDIIWHKPNPMPESVTDRCTKAHEYVFLLSKSERYYFDGDAIRQPHAPKSLTHRGGGKAAGKTGQQDGLGKVASGNFGNWNKPRTIDPRGANRRSVWTINTKPFKGAHFATFPTELVLPCVLAGCPASGSVLDPFNGAGTTGLVALSNGRNYIGIELNPEYVEITRQRLGLLAQTIAFEEHIHA